MAETKTSKCIMCIKCKKDAVCSGFCRSHFIKYFEKKVRKTISRFKLFNPMHKIAVAVSGGKDSTVCLYILKKLGYNVEAVTVDALIGNYTKENLKNLKDICKKNKINLNEISFRKEFGYSLCGIKSILQSKKVNYSSCMICGVLRRYLLNKYAKKLKFDVIATGHTLDDEAQAFLMNIFRNDIKLATRQGPISGFVRDEKFVTRVKPLYLCSEKETTTYSKLMNFPVNYGRCPCSVDAFRRNFRQFLDDFEQKHPNVKHNIVNFFLKTVYPIKAIAEAESSAEKINACTLCDEPSAKDVCKKCEILLKLQK